MLGFCSGSDRYYAVGVKPGHWAIHNALGAHVIDVSAPVRPTDQQADVIRAALEAVRPARFDVGDPETMNLDLRDGGRESRVHVLGVSGNEKSGYSVELSDGSFVPWDVWNREVRERVNG